MELVVEINKGFTHPSALVVDQGMFYGKIYAPDAQELFDLGILAMHGWYGAKPEDRYSLPKEVVVD